MTQGTVCALRSDPPRAFRSMTVYFQAFCGKWVRGGTAKMTEDTGVDINRADMIMEVDCEPCLDIMEEEGIIDA